MIRIGRRTTRRACARGLRAALADAWIAAAALEQNGVLVHKDPEFQVFSLEQEVLKPKK